MNIQTQKSYKPFFLVTHFQIRSTTTTVTRIHPQNIFRFTSDPNNNITEFRSLPCVTTTDRSKEEAKRRGC